jgi:hypothetical protein
MPICPQCASEYDVGLTQCPNCGAAVPPIHEENLPVDYFHCVYCDGEVTQDSDFCPHCGNLFVEAPELKCDTHSDREAAGLCIICRKALCDECLVRKRDRIFCSEHHEVEVMQDWANVFQSIDYLQASIVKGKLESAGIGCQVYNQMQMSTIGFLEGGIARTQLKTPVKLFVPIPDFQKAYDFLLAENLVFKYQCDRCGCEFNEENARCPQCDAEFIT